MADSDTVESSVFRKNYAKLLDGLQDSLFDIVPKLYEEGIITSETRDKALSDSQDKRSSSLALVNGLESKIKGDTGVFHTLIKLLETKQALKALVETMKQDYGLRVSEETDTQSHSSRQATPSALTPSQSPKIPRSMSASDTKRTLYPFISLIDASDADSTGHARPGMAHGRGTSKQIQEGVKQLGEYTKTHKRDDPAVQQLAEDLGQLTSLAATIEASHSQTLGQITSLAATIGASQPRRQIEELQEKLMTAQSQDEESLKERLKVAVEEKRELAAKLMEKEKEIDTLHQKLTELQESKKATDEKFGSIQQVNKELKEELFLVKTEAKPHLQMTPDQKLQNIHTKIHSVISELLQHGDEEIRKIARHLRRLLTTNAREQCRSWYL